MIKQGALSRTGSSASRLFPRASSTSPSRLESEEGGAAVVRGVLHGTESFMSSWHKDEERGHQIDSVRRYGTTMDMDSKSQSPQSREGGADTG